MPFCVCWSQLQTVTLAQSLYKYKCTKENLGPKPDYLSKNIIHFFFCLSTLFCYGYMEYPMENTTYSGGVELEYDSRDMANHCRVTCFNLGNFFLRVEEKGRRDQFL